ncbi:hypothetical protein O6H91_17G026300 [Diphasiastrum complanatum]|nr:hypothetical protein O6H91_17G026300 [Diphasiastrum complanatum]
MQKQGVKPDKFTFVSVLKACASLFALEEGRYIHAQVLSSGCDLDIYVWNGLVDMYGKCGSIYDACIVFNTMPEHDVVSWNSMIAAYEKCGYGEKALECFQQMHREQIEPDAITFLGGLNACSSLLAIDEGKKIHQNVIEHGFESDIFIASSLIDMYARCGAVEDGWRVFSDAEQRDVVLWNSMIMGYLKCANWNKAWALFQQMQEEGVKPNSATFVGILNGCAEVAALEEGRRLHAQTIQGNWASDAYVGTCLVDMYIKCGCVQDARRVFSNMPVRSVVSWNVMIHGYLQCGQGERVLQLFQQMQQEKVNLDSITFLGIVNACASVAALEEGWSVHASIIRARLEMDIFMENCLVHMYAKCGSIEDSCRVFRNMSKWDGISWNAMLEGYAMHGLGNEALLLFEEMCWKDIRMDDCTFLSLLSALSHSGLVDEGGYCFESMSPIYGVQATVKHYCCMVDLYGRLGLLDEAEDIIKTMRHQPDACVWMVLLNACRIHNNVQVGERAAMHVFESDPENESGYVLLSNIYAAAGNWDSTHQARTKRGEHKQQACTLMS